VDPLEDLTIEVMIIDQVVIRVEIKEALRKKEELATSMII
jgi:hypothetical protein